MAKTIPTRIRCASAVGLTVTIAASSLLAQPVAAADDRENARRDPAAERLECKHVRRQGSLIKRRVCLTETQWLAIRRWSTRVVEQIGNRELTRPMGTGADL